MFEGYIRVIQAFYGVHLKLSHELESFAFALFKNNLKGCFYNLIVKKRYNLYRISINKLRFIINSVFYQKTLFGLKRNMTGSVSWNQSKLKNVTYRNETLLYQVYSKYTCLFPPPGFKGIVWSNRRYSYVQCF